jgi:hypothetical protein
MSHLVLLGKQIERRVPIGKMRLGGQPEYGGGADAQRYGEEPIGDPVEEGDRALGEGDNGRFGGRRGSQVAHGWLSGGGAIGGFRDMEIDKTSAGEMLGKERLQIDAGRRGAG